jgi:hypothetical protein
LWKDEGEETEEDKGISVHSVWESFQKKSALTETYQNPFKSV